ncbi:SNO glutamine amidotransferase [Ferroglobus placidus DSM 10642]|uniref:Pyridoxal 5'-phosphate synthase subunit PdxT n=1 Tax=Ferroglobus placidus (strain DSM 10642 / AEDII12DO) TaxID=589924 RepID=D3S077_FERPA|nr:pyridoxal 5'-phosphate synthase glutaminase subunit PdxT [Ferroglobus placidus]ADC66140.1 SNO glutamine amidotransferase [Ferroglobus placidus DSM 10642]
MKIAVVGVQGDVEEHVIALKKALRNLKIDGEVVATRRKGVVSKSDAVVIPGGESTTISRLIWRDSIAEEILSLYEEGKPIMGTCAGLIILAKRGDEQVEKTRTKLLGILDVKVKRNAFGRQRESFEAEIDVKGIGKYKAVFIRAPIVEEVGEKVEVLAKFEDKIVAVQQGKVLGLAFHPELTDDTRIHEYFIKMID